MSLILIVALVFCIFLYFETKLIKKRFDKQREMASITKLLFKKKQKYDTIIESIKTDFPLLANYLMQVSKIISTDAYNLENIKIQYVKNHDCNSTSFGDKFFDEFRRCNEKVKNELLEVSAILGRIYKLNHPIKYKINTFKKNMMLHILYFLVKTLHKMTIAVKIFGDKNTYSKNDIKKIHSKLMIEVL